MSTKANATIRLSFPNTKQLTTLLNALTPEVSSTRRANVTLKRDGSFLVLSVEAEDTVALRATLNAYLHWINSAINVMNAVEDS